MPFELREAKGKLTEDEMISLLDYTKYYDKLELPVPRNMEKVLDDFRNEKFIRKEDGVSWSITNFGALMIAKDLKRFDLLARKSVGVIWYQDGSRLNAVRET